MNDESTDHTIGEMTLSPNMSVAEVVKMHNDIRSLMKAALKPGIHYGTIPGCGDKPVLLQPGAHKLGQLFNLCPSYEMKQRDCVDGNHREYETTCRLTHRVTAATIAHGVGVCSTMESKYRFRWDNTGDPVPKNYWDDRDAEKIGGLSFVPRKIKGKWLIFRRVDHDNPADYYNTVKKISAKRAYNAAILVATAASDLFSPDDEVDMEFVTPPAEPDQEPVKTPARKSKGTDVTRNAGTSAKAKDTQVSVIIRALDKTEVTIKEFCTKFDIKQIHDLPMAEVNEALDWIKNPGELA